MAGRGRGRFIPEDIIDAPLRRPLSDRGLAPSKIPSGNDAWTLVLEQLFSGPLDDLNCVTILHECVFNQSPDPEAFVRHLFKKIFDNACNGNHIARFIYLASKNPQIGQTIFKNFFVELEVQFKGREQLKSSYGVSGYHNFVQFFSEVTHLTRNVSFAPLLELITSLYLLTDSLASSTNEDDIRLFVICVNRYLSYLKMETGRGEAVRGMDGVKDGSRLTDEIRRRLCMSSTKLNERCTAWLLAGLEAAIHGSLPKQGFGFYSSVLPPAALSQLNPAPPPSRLPKIFLTSYPLLNPERDNFIIV